MDLMMNKVFIQVMDKLKRELQLHIESQAMPQFITAKNIRCVKWCKLNDPPYQEVVDKSNHATNDSVQHWELKTMQNGGVFSFV